MIASDTGRTMNKQKQLVKNTAILGIGILSTKVLTFLLLPLYTKVLEPNDYGLVDFLISICTLVIPFATFEINTGIFRFLIERDSSSKNDKAEIISSGMIIQGIGLSLVLLVSLIVNFFYPIPNYPWVGLYVFSLAIAKFMSDTARGFGNNTIYSVANFLNTLVSLSLNLLLILVFRLGAVSILIASALGNIIGSVVIFLKLQIFTFFNIASYNPTISKRMLKYTLPLMPNTLSWWVVSESDRIIVMTFIGAAANGIYAAAHKIPGIYTTLFSVFCLAWTESVARNAEDSEFVCKTFKESVNIMLYMLLGIIACSSLFFSIIIGEKYQDSYWHILILLIAIFFSSISSMHGGIFSGKMDSKTVAVTTIIGAVINITIHLLLVKFINLYAASISTTISYMIISLIRGHQVKKWYPLKLFDSKDLYFIPLSLFVLIGFTIKSTILNTISIILIILCFYVFNRSLASSIFKMVFKRRK